MNRLPRVAVLVEFTGDFGRRLLSGIVQYNRGHRCWNLQVIYGSAEHADVLRHWDGEGVIARVRNAQVAEVLADLNVPRVIFGNLLPPGRSEAPVLEGPRIGVERAAAMVVDYFRARGFRHFAYCAFPDKGSWGRQEMFLDVASRAGLACHSYPASDPALVSDSHEARQEHLARWLSTLPRPTALAAADDLRGYEVLEACRLAGVRVPEDLAVIGYANDTLLCELSTPTLSSIEFPFERLGYEAAGLLTRLMAGEVIADSPLQVPPVGIVTRGSTDITAIDDPDVAAAMQFIRQHASQPISVEDVLQQVAVSRSTLKRRFRTTLGRHMKDEIERAHIERAKELLTCTDLKMPEVARRCGYANAPRLTEAFKRVVGVTPSDYRRSEMKMGQGWTCQQGTAE